MSTVSEQPDTISHPNCSDGENPTPVACFSTLTINADVVKIKAGDTIQVVLGGIPNHDTQKIYGVYPVTMKVTVLNFPFLITLIFKPLA